MLKGELPLVPLTVGICLVGQQKVAQIATNHCKHSIGLRTVLFFVAAADDTSSSISSSSSSTSSVLWINFFPLEKTGFAHYQRFQLLCHGGLANSSRACHIRQLSAFVFVGTGTAIVLGGCKEVGQDLDLPVSAVQFVLGRRWKNKGGSCSAYGWLSSRIVGRCRF